ncbi:MAG TPA: hypothetical protein VEX86_10360 [Longimicrobium sp.]|nr:hypothetical protein [Longimicrobium sp.]
MITTRILKTALAGAVAVLAACSDSTGNDNPGPGSLSFSYSGARAGGYSANGEFVGRDTTFTKQPFAVGARSRQAGQGMLGLLSYQPVTASAGTMVVMAMPEVSGSGSFDFADESCLDEDFTACPLGFVVFDTNPDLLEDENSQFFIFSSGTVNIQSTSGGRLRGTFSGTAETLFADSTITITNGTFDVPVRSESSLGLNRAAARARLMQSRHARP